MPTARDLIKNAQILRPEQTLLAEEVERNPGPQSLQFTPTGATAEGVVGRTSNGGVLTVANGAQGFTPALGQSYQIQKTSGQVSLVANSRTEAITEAQEELTPIVATRAPTANDAGRDGQLWVDISPSPVAGIRQVELYVYIGALGAHAQAAGGTSTPTQIAAAPPPGIDPANPLAPGNTPTVNGAEWLDSSVNRLWKWSVAAGRYLPTGGSLAFRNRNPLGFAKAESLIDGDTILSSASGSEGGQWVWNGTAFETAHCCSAPEEPPGSFRYDQLLAIYLSWQGSDGCSRERMFEQDAPLPVDPGSASFFQDSTVVDGVTTWTAYINYTFDGENRQHEVTDIDDELGTESGPFTLCGDQFEYESQVPVAQ